MVEDYAMLFIIQNNKSKFAAHVIQLYYATLYTQFLFFNLTYRDGDEYLLPVII